MCVVHAVVECVTSSCFCSNGYVFAALLSCLISVSLFCMVSRIYLFLRFVLHRLSDVIYIDFYQFILNLSFFYCFIPSSIKI